MQRASEDLALFVIDTDENETLLMHRIRSDDIYRKQEGYILSSKKFVDLLFIDWHEIPG